MRATRTPGTPAPPERVWPRAAALFVVVLATSVVTPSVLLAVPFLLLVGMSGLRGVTMLIAAMLAMLVVMSGARDGVWYLERGWALLLGGWFVGISLIGPTVKTSTRALAAVFGAMASAAIVIAVRSGAWSALDWAVTDRVHAAMAAAIDTMVVVRGGAALSPALVATVYQAAEGQAAIFPALTGIASMAALAIAWWGYTLLSIRGGEALGPLRDFRFNDHLAWVFVAGLVLLVAPWDEPLQRVGTNVVVFMGALYVVRGAAVVVFMRRGLPVLAYVMTALVLIFLPGLVLGSAMMIGIGDSYLDIRRRAKELTT